MHFGDLEERLADGKELNAFDQEAVETVAALITRARDAKRIIEQEGPIASNDRGVPIEHPAVKVERMASAELRGWVKERPDLFGGMRKKDEPTGARRKLDRFKTAG